MFAINEETTRKRGQKTELAETATGQCANRYCGTVLFDQPEDVPGGWIIVWHVDCGGLDQRRWNYAGSRQVVWMATGKAR